MRRPLRTRAESLDPSDDGRTRDAPAGHQVAGVSKEFMRMAWWTAMFPGLIIFVTVLALNLIGNGLNDAPNPRLRER